MGLDCRPGALTGRLFQRAVNHGTFGRCSLSSRRRREERVGERRNFITPLSGSLPARASRGERKKVAPPVYGPRREGALNNNGLLSPTLPTPLREQGEELFRPGRGWKMRTGLHLRILCFAGL